MNTFREYHPGVTALYFLAVITVNIVVFDPVLFGISFVSQSVFYLYLKGTRAGILFAGKCLAFVVMCTVVNAFVNHRGGSVLFFAPPCTPARGWSASHAGMHFLWDHDRFFAVGFHFVV